MKFKDLTEGSPMYCAEVKNSELIGGDINIKQVSKIYEYTTSDNTEIHFSDGTSIIPIRNESYVIKGLTALSNNILEPYNFTVYACSYDDCLEVFKRLITTKIKQVNDEFIKANAQINKLYLMKRLLSDIENKATSVKLEPIYVD